jgi:hypothetical protein
MPFKDIEVLNVTVAQSYEAYKIVQSVGKGTLCGTEVWEIPNKPCILNG